MLVMPHSRAPWNSHRTVGVDRIELVPDPPVNLPPAGALEPPGPDWEPLVVPSTGAGIWTYTAPNTDIPLEVWQTWRDAYPDTGWWPLLFNVEWAWPSVSEPPVGGGEPAGSGAELLTRRLWGGTYPLADQIPCRGSLDWPIFGKPKRTKPFNQISALDVILVPAAAPWLVPEVLGWNGARKHGVYGAQHSLVLRRWAGLYGVEPFAMSLAGLILQSTRPPQTKEAAWAATVELVGYCPELVDPTDGDPLEQWTSHVTGGQWDCWFDWSTLDGDGSDDEDEDI